MVATKIADIIVPDVFNAYITERTAELSAFWQSGVVETVEGLNLLGMEGGQTLTMPFFQDLTGNDEILSDAVDLTVDKITTDRDVAVLHARGKAWGVNDLARALSGADPMAAIGDLVADYWARRKQAALISTLNGAMAAANMTANVHDISALSGTAAVIDGASLDDANAFVKENHAWRREIRLERRTLVRRAITLLDGDAMRLASLGRFEEAMARWAEADILLRNAYPDLASVAALKKGIADTAELRALFGTLRVDQRSDESEISTQTAP